jgi:hypothetical protein
MAQLSRTIQSAILESRLERAEHWTIENSLLQGVFQAFISKKACYRLETKIPAQSSSVDQAQRDTVEPRVLTVKDQRMKKNGTLAK